VDSIGTVFPTAPTPSAGENAAKPVPLAPDGDRDSLLARQLFLVIAMSDSGRDLEKHVLSSGMEEARAILAQAGWGPTGTLA